ncbi:hypothetical protein [Geminocystis sp.]|uniref:LIC_10190 family membrane protein n=1 Tax=Geminocystis sp. TaxID=2664100 RepID=UPI003593B784
MLYFISVWTILLFICLILGIAILNSTRIDYLTRKTDRFFLSIWLGIISLTLLLLSISFFLPLSNLVGLSASLILILVSVSFSKNRQEIKSLLTKLNLNYIIFYFLIAIIISAITTQKIIWFDTGLYHWGSIKWLSQFGTVYGVGLINPKFGFNAGWFAFSAPLYAPFLGSHIGAISNGFLFFIGVIHFLISFKNLFIKTKILLISDTFIFIYYSFILSVYTITSFSKSPILISFSPDIPVNFFIGIIAWSLLLLSNNYKVSNTTNYLFLPQFIPLFLSLGTVSIKLSALPLLGITFFFSCFNNYQKSKIIKKFIISSCLSILLLIPTFGYSIKTTGCFLYPSPFLCFNVPWAINKTVIQEEKTSIIGIDSSKNYKNPVIFILNKRLQWLKSSIKLQIMVLLIIFSVIFSFLIIKNKAKINSIQGYAWIIALGLLGITFIMIQIPLLRFGLGYFCLIPSLFISIFFMPKLISLFHVNKFVMNKLFFFILISFTSLIIIFDNSIKERLFLPLKLTEIEVIKAQINDVSYVYPDNWKIKCWNHELPCSALPIYDNIRLKDPKKGIGGGFLNIQDRKN